MAKPAPKAAPASSKKVSAAKTAASAAKRTAARPAKTAAKGAPAKGKAAAPVKRSPAKIAKPGATKASAGKAQPKATATKAVVKPAKRAAPAKAPGAKSAARSAKSGTRASASAPATPASKTAGKRATKAEPKKVKDTVKAPAPKLVTPFDDKFLDAQRRLLLEERAKLLGQAEVLEGEAASLMADLEPGDVQFDDESGEGDSIVVERERDLALSAQARQLVIDIDAALSRIDERTYGLSLVSGRTIPKERLRAIPWATELVEEKVGGLGRR